MPVLAFGQDGSANEGHYPPWAQVGSHGMLAYDAVQNDIGDVMGPHFLVTFAFLYENVVCRSICSSTETQRKQRSRRRKLPRPLTSPQSLITKELSSGVLSSGPPMWLCRLLLLLVLIGVLLQVYTITCFFLEFPHLWY